MNKAILMLAAMFALSVGAYAQAATPANPPTNGAMASPSPATGTKSSKATKKHHKKHKSSKTEAQ